MKSRPRILISISAPLIIGGMAIILAGWTSFPVAALILGLGVFLLGAAGVDYMTSGEFRRLDDQMESDGGSPGDHLQHILAPQRDRHEQAEHSNNRNYHVSNRVR